MAVKEYELESYEKEMKGIYPYDLQLPFENKCLECKNLKICKKKIKVLKNFDPNDYEATVYSCEHAEFCRSISHVFKKYEMHKRKENNDAPKPIPGLEDDEL